MHDLKGLKVTVSGEIGSGKSSVVALLSKKLGVRTLSTGAIQREIAARHGMTTLELNLHSEVNKEIDDEIDAYTTSLREDPEPKIIDSRMAWHFLPTSFKVYLIVDLSVAVERVLSDAAARSSAEELTSATALERDIIRRRGSERFRFSQKYGVDCCETTNFDLVVDTSDATQQQVADLVFEGVQQFLAGIPMVRFWMSPKNLYPTEHVRSLGTDRAAALRRSIKDRGLDPGHPVKLIRYEGQYFILDGHQRVSASLFEGHPFVPGELIFKDSQEIVPGMTVEDLVRSQVSLSTLYDWEDCHGFQFRRYPSTCFSGMTIAS